jgi:iron only hydrogenase large subunit-like protein
MLNVIWRFFESFQEIFQQFRQECYVVLDCIASCTFGLVALSTKQWFKHTTNKQIQFAADDGNSLLSSAHIPGPFTKSIHPHVEILLRK